MRDIGYGIRAASALSIPDTAIIWCSCSSTRLLLEILADQHEGYVHATRSASQSAADKHAS